ncbi:MAG TPA: inorganic diphosphatase [Abditibacteriaceae bacterium]|jgi:inorganic pyrophosphatase
MDFNHIPPFYTQGGDEPHGCNAIIETPRGGRHKFALKDEFGVFELRRTIPNGLAWPCDFGFVPQTLAEDGDSIDICLLIDEPTFPGVLVRARILGVIGLRKNGEQNDRLLACPISLPGAGSRWDDVRDLGDVSPRVLRELSTFLLTYGTFEGHDIELTGIGDAEVALQKLREAHENWKNK